MGRDAVDQELVSNNNLEKKVANYVDVEGVSTGRLNFGLWYLRHRQLFFLALVWALSLVAVVLWSYSLYYFGHYLLVGVKQDQINELALSEKIVNVVQNNKMEKFSYKFTTVVHLGAERYDLVAKVVNENDAVLAKFNYYFIVDGVKMGEGTNFVMPRSHKYITSVVDGLSLTPQDVTVVIVSVEWPKIDIRQIGDWDEFSRARLNFSVSDEKFVNANLSTLSEKIPINMLSFKVRNDTAFNYLELPWQIIMYSGSEVVAVKNYVMNNLVTRASKEVVLTVVGNLPSITKLEIVPDVNILDERVYQK